MQHIAYFSQPLNESWNVVYKLHYTLYKVYGDHALASKAVQPAWHD